MKKIIDFIKQYTLKDFIIDLKYLVLPCLVVVLGWVIYITLIDILKYGI